MAVRQDKPVAVGPVRIGGVEFQVAGKQYGCHVGHAHRGTGVARIGARWTASMESARMAFAKLLVVCR